MRKVPRSEDIVTLNEAAQRLGVSPPFLTKVIADGGFPARRVGRRYFIAWESVVEWSKGVDTGKRAPKRNRVLPTRDPKLIPTGPQRPDVEPADDTDTDTAPDPGDGG